ncbi:MAG TPA: hypothetical protein DC047_12085 [Blastocatellia bacterium]|nr:hypothetical protein [Blastocatellia bacterium]
MDVSRLFFPITSIIPGQIDRKTGLRFLFPQRLSFEILVRLSFVFGDLCRTLINCSVHIISLIFKRIGLNSLRKIEVLFRALILISKTSA